MSNPITWKNVNIPNQGAAAQLARQGSNQLVNSISGLGDTLKTLRDREQADTNKLSADKAQALMNQISTFDATKLAETKASGILSPEALAQSGINNEGIAKILAHAQTQDDRIYDEGRQVIQREITDTQDANFLSQDKRNKAEQGRQDKARQDTDLLAATIRDLPSTNTARQNIQLIQEMARTRNLDPTATANAIEQVRAGDDITKILTPEEQRKLQAEIETNAATTDAQVGQLQSQLASAKAKLPDAPISRKDPESLIALNEGIDKIRGGDRFWNPFRDDTDEVKQEVIAEGEAQGASPNQIIAALGAVADGGGDYSFKEFQSRLKEIVDDPELDKARNKAAALQDAVNRVNINLPKSQQQQRQAAIDSFLAKAR